MSRAPAKSNTQLSSRQTEQDVDLNALVRDMSAVKAQFTQIQTSHFEMKECVTFSNECYEEMKNQFDVLKEQIKESDARITRLEQQIQDIQMQTRPATVELRNVPLIADESTEDLVLVVLAVGKVIDMEVQRDELRDVYRLPGTSGTPRPIVAEFVSVMTRNEFLANVRWYNERRRAAQKLHTQSIGLVGEKTPIYIDEHLLPSKKKLIHDKRAGITNGHK